MRVDECAGGRLDLWDGARIAGDVRRGRKRNAATREERAPTSKTVLLPAVSNGLRGFGPRDTTGTVVQWSLVQGERWSQSPEALAAGWLGGAYAYQILHSRPASVCLGEQAAVTYSGGELPAAPQTATPTCHCRWASGVDRSALERVEVMLAPQPATRCKRESQPGGWLHVAAADSESQ